MTAFSDTRISNVCESADADVTLGEHGDDAADVEVVDLHQLALLVDDA